MKEAFVRLLGISILTVIGSVMVLYGLRFSGSTQHHTPLDHPVLAKKFFLIAKAGGSDLAPANTIKAFDRTLSIDPNIMMEIDIQRTKDGHFILYGHKDLSTQTNGKGSVFQHTLMELQQLDAGHMYKSSDGQQTYRGRGVRLLSLNEYLTKYPKTHTVIDMEEQDPAKMYGLNELLRKYKAKKRVILTSRFPETIRFLQREDPLYLFNLPHNRLTAALVMSGLYIETLASIKSDIVISPYKMFDKILFDERLAIELGRRSKPIVLETSKPITYFPKWLKTRLSGVLTPDPTKYLQHLSGR